MIVVGSMISLGYYLRVVAAIWMREAPSGAERRPSAAWAACASSPAARPSAGGAGIQFEVVAMALLFGAATIFFGIVPQPLFNFVQHAARSLGIY